MLKAIFAYWCVFSLRFVDNLHQRVKFNMMFRYLEGIVTRVGAQFMPGGGSEFSGRVREWMSESQENAEKRIKFTEELGKIDECEHIIAQLNQHQR